MLENLKKNTFFIFVIEAVNYDLVLRFTFPALYSIKIRKSRTMALFNTIYDFIYYHYQS